ncbi:MAG: hypothetical protein RR063_07460 [Anaerovoracaceae bacterium]
MDFVVVDHNKSDLELFVKAIRKAVPECQIQPFTDPLLSAKYICNHPVDMVFQADIPCDRSTALAHTGAKRK